MQFRRGIVEHIETGKMTCMEYACYNLMILLANSSNGVWMGSSVALAAKFGAGDITQRAAKRILASLECKKYIHRALKVQGAKGNFPVFIDKYLITSGDLTGRYVNAAESTDINHPVCYPCPETGRETRPESGRESGPYSINQEVKTPKKHKSTSGEVDVQKVLSHFTEEEQAAVAEIWPYYLEKCERDPNRYEMLATRVSKIVMRFKEQRKKAGTYQGAVAVLKEAIDNLAASDFHMGRDANSNGKRYCDIVDNLFKSPEVLSKRLNDVRVVSNGTPRAPAKPLKQEMEEQLGKNYAAKGAKPA